MQTHIFVRRDGSRYLVKAESTEKAWAKLEKRFEKPYGELRCEMAFEKLLEFGANDICTLRHNPPF